MNDARSPDALESRRIGAGHLQLPPLPEIPRARYTDESFYKMELDAVFKRSWLMVGHVSEFVGEGSYIVLDLPFAPVLIIRGKDGELRAFLNACRHRGAAVLREPHGCTRVMSCPYHSWTYDLTGRLIGYPAREAFPGLDPSKYSLQGVRCELWEGFVFINLNPDAAPLLDGIQPLVARYSGPASGALRIVNKQSWDVECNWKMAVEAFREAYHVKTVHPRTAGAALAGYETSHEMYAHGGGSIFIPYEAAIMQQEWAGVTQRATELPRLNGTDDPRFNITTMLATLFPNTILGFQPTGFPVISAWPYSHGRCRLDVHWYGMDWGSGPRPAEWDKVISDFTALTHEDLANLSSMQRSVEADPLKGIPVSDLECLVYQMHAEIDKAIGVERVPPQLRVPDVLGAFITA